MVELVFFVETIKYFIHFMNKSFVEFDIVAVFCKHISFTRLQAKHIHYYNNNKNSILSTTTSKADKKCFSITAYCCIYTFIIHYKNSLARHIIVIDSIKYTFKLFHVKIPFDCNSSFFISMWNLMLAKNYWYELTRFQAKFIFFISFKNSNRIQHCNINSYKYNDRVKQIPDTSSWLTGSNTNIKYFMWKFHFVVKVLFVCMWMMIYSNSSINICLTILKISHCSIF